MRQNRHSGPVRFTAFTAAFLAAWLPVFAAPAPAPKRVTKHRNPSRDAGAENTIGDVDTFDDPFVRQAAIRGLGRYNGSIVAIDPNSGRILTIVNQKMAFSAGFKPCSTIKPVIAVAALQEGIVTRNTMIRVKRRKSLNLTEAMAHSNNAYFEELGRRMGFATVSNYARTLGLGELAGYEIPEEQPGSLPDGPPRRGGVARMSSFGEGIQMTPLQLGALVSSVANGGTLYYLQYPRSVDDEVKFEPRIKRTLEIQSLIPDLREGMHAAVLRGTARRSNMPDSEEASGKTGSCSDSGMRLGWFASYVDQPRMKIVLVVLMRGHTFADRGPVAAGIAGRIYHQLDREEYSTNPVTVADKPVIAETSSR